MSQEITITSRDIANAIRKLTDLYLENRFGGSNNPSDTVQDAVTVLGYALAAAAIATLVNIEAWDGRIAERNAQFAASVPNALSEEQAMKHYITYPHEIHPAHLDQLAYALRMYTLLMNAETA